ncbi:hypothetical protein [Streptomyces sp. NBC_00690]|uniref:hypothetical protein n=1 Tax=Streptomyces sp. NBC_00690 TaxID=2975808 RepID=UPI002E2C89B2|nr:hypothetical protein [Streptomyces sp. NBC_00690]
MSTYEALPRFTTERHRCFRRIMRTFVHDIRTGRGFRPGLHVKWAKCARSGVYELTWSMGTGLAGRATWQYGSPRRPIIWRRIGTRDTLTGP